MPPFLYHTYSHICNEILSLTDISIQYILFLVENNLNKRRQNEGAEKGTTEKGKKDIKAE